MDFIIDSNTTSSNNNIINGISDNIVYNSFLISNINITSNYASNISNVLKTNIDNNLANNSNFTSGTGFNTSNYAFNISNILKTNIDANNTTTNTSIGNTSNYASNISNVLLNLINTNSGTVSSNYATNISNVLINSINTNISNLYSTDIIVYTPVRQYPSKAYNSITNETTTTFLSKTVYTRDLTLDTTGISYGSGAYTMYISTTYDLGSAASQLIFDYNTDVNSAGMHFKSSTYDASGLYTQSNGIVSGYNGEWVILKLPNPIIFNKLEIISRNGFIPRAPAEWRCYGSNDNGNTFTEITEATQLTRLTTGNYVNNTYTKSFNNSISYLYIGFTFNKIVGDGLTLNFIELKIFGQERIQPYYISSNILTTYLSNYYNKTETNTLITNSSNYTINASNALKANIDTYLANNSNFTSGTGFNTSNYASNISNVLLTNINTNYLQKTGGNITGNTNINGIVNINSGAGYAITYGYMQSGSLTIGGTNVNYGGNFYTGGNWNGTNTAGLLMECGNNTEIAIHDNATRLASLMYYEGVDNKITLGRNMGWGAISTIVINGNTGIGTINPSSKLHIEHSSTSLNTSNGGLYVYNPNNTATSSSVIGTRIGGTSANKASISLDVLNNYGWSIYITGNDTEDKCLRFNSSCDTTGLDRLKIRGSDGYTNINGGCRILNDLTVDGTINAPSILINNLNISNSIINNNTYTSNISNVLQTNINTTNNNLSTNYYNQTQTNTLITNTSNYAFNISNILLNVINTNSGTGSSNYASNISNVLQGNINTTNNNLATNYLQLAGGTMTGPITTNSTTGGSLIILKTSSTVATTSILLQNNLSIYGNIGLGCSAYNNNYASNLFIETTYDILINSGNYSTIPKMIFKSSGNIGIGTTDPGTNILQIGGGGRLRIGSGDSDYTLIGTTNNDDGIFNYSATTTKIFLAGNNCTASGIGCIKYYATTNQGCHIFYAGNAERFKIDNGGNLYNNGSLINFSSYATNTTLTTNYYNKTDIDTNITNNSNYATNISNVLQGNINTTNTNISTNYFPKAGGTMTGTLNISSLNTKLSFGSRTQDYLIDLYNGVYGIGVNDYVMRYNAWDLASHKFYSGTTNTASISSNGILTISAVNIGSVSINNWLFNSSGFNHETISDFNNITGFGYRFINGIGSAPTNGPATGDTQYYSWYIGLGAEYPAISGSSSYGMQFAIGRSDTNPKLCIRRKQDNSWTSWQGLTAEKAVSLTSGDKTISGQLQILASMYNGLYITNTNSNDIVSIELRNNTTYSSFIGIGCTAYTGNYKNNLFIQSPQSLILNTNGNATSATPNFIINTSGNVGIGTTNPTEDLHIYGNDNSFIKVDAVGGTGQSGLRLFAGSGTSNRATRIDFFNNVASITQARWSMLNDTDQNGTNDFRIYNAGGSSNILTLLQSGNIGIGTINPLQKLHIEGALYLTGIPSNPGNNVSASFWNQGNVGPTISGYAIAFQTNGTTERMRIDSNGNVNIGTSGQLYKLYVNGTTYLNDNTTINGSLSATGLITTSGNIDCGGGIAINGANAFSNYAENVDIGNKSNTYLILKEAGANSDWCYIRQIGGNNAFKLAFDFHDDGTDARFCIRNVKSTDATDTITEVFTVDNGNTTMTGICTANGGFSGSGASLTSIPFSALTGTSPYVLKAGDIMSGDLTISKAAARLTLKGTGAGAVTRLDLSAYDHTTFEPTCSFIITDDTQYSSSLNIKIKTPGSNANSQFSALFIKPDGNIGIGNDNPTYKLYVNGTTYLNNNTTINGSLSATTINRNGVEIDSRYLQLSGGTMSGQISGVTTLNATSVISSTLSTTNNGSIAIPSVGVNGGIGDRLVFWAGTSAAYPFSLGIDSSTLWYSVPGGSSHKFYHNGSVITTISSSGLSLGNPVGYKVLSLWDNATPNNFQFVGFGNNGGLCFNNNTSTDAFQFRVGTSTTAANELMRINGNGSVCIGTASATSVNTKLTISGTSTAASQPIVRIEQLGTWNGSANNYAFQVSGYSDLGGIRINGTDIYNTIFTTGNNDMGLSTNAGVIKFLTNSGNERMRILNNGNVGIGTNDSSSKLTVEGRTITGNGSSTYSSAFNDNTVGLTVANAAGIGNPQQLVICDTSNANTALLLGTKYNAGNAYSIIQSIVAGSGYKTLCLNPYGGNIGIGTTNPSCKLSLGSSTGYKVLSLWDNGETNDFKFNGFGANGGLCFNIYNNTSDSFQFRAGVNSTSANEVMRLSGTGNLSLGTTDTASYKMRIRGTNPTYLRIETDTDAVAQVSGIEFGIPGFSSAGSAKIISTTYGGDVNDLRFSTSSAANSTSVKMTINGNGNISCTNDFTAGGNVGIGITNPFANLCIGSPAVASDGVLVLSKNGGGNRNFKMGYDGSFNFCFGDFGAALSGNTWRSTDLTINYLTGNIGIGVVPHATYKLDVNGSLNASTINRAGVEIDSRYLKLSGDTMTGQLQLKKTDGNTPLYIQSSSTTANNCIQFQNDTLKTAYVGLCGSVYGNYSDNFIIETTKSIILAAGGSAFASAPKMIISSNGNIGIGTTNPNNILQVGDGGKFRISNGISDYTLIGTKDTDGATNTRIVISGNTRGGYAGSIEYVATSSTGHHLFYSSDNTNYTERMRILSDGKIGIGTATPNRNFEVFGTNPALVIRAADENQTSTLFLGTGYINIGAYKCAIIAAGYTGWSRSKLHFCLNNNGASNEYPTYNATIADAKMTILPSGNVGIGTVTPTSILHIEHSSTSFNAEYGGLYLYNPNTSSTSCSCLGARINGSTANKAGLSLDVSGYYGWSMYINGNDTTDRQLRFNSTWDGTGTEILQIRGSDGYATFSGNMQIGSKTSQKGTGPASLLIGDSTGTSSLILTNVANAVWKIDTLNLCLNFYNDTTTSGTFVNKMQITKAGNLLVSGDISAFANMSDKRLKHNITNLSINCIDLLNNIKPVEFIWNDMDEIINIKRNTYDHGFIAQDIEILLPNIVNQYDKYKSIKYEKLTPYLVKGFQELYKLIQVLQEDNIRQQQQIIDLQNQINMIKSQLS